MLSHQKDPSAGTAGNSSASITLSFDINEQGIPTHLRVEKSSDPAREAEVLAAVEEWTFSPGLKNGQPVVVPCTANFVLGETVAQKAPQHSSETAPSKAVDPAKMAAIEEMFTVTKADQMIGQVLSQVEIGLRGQISKSVNDLIPPGSDNHSKILADSQEFEKQIFAMVEGRIDFQKMKPELVKIYDETLTTEEITAALTFYKSPAGAAILQKLPTITAKCVLLGQQMMRDAMPELQKMTKVWVESMKNKYGDAPGIK